MKCPNTEFSLVRLFFYPRTEYGPEKTPYLDTLRSEGSEYASGTIYLLFDKNSRSLISFYDDIISFLWLDSFIRLGELFIPCLTHTFFMILLRFDFRYFATKI